MLFKKNIKKSINSLKKCQIKFRMIKIKKTYLELLPNHIEEEIYNMKIRSDFLDVEIEMFEKYYQYIHNNPFYISKYNYNLLNTFEKSKYVFINNMYYFDCCRVKGYQIFKSSRTCESLNFHTAIKVNNSHKKIIYYSAVSPEFCYNYFLCLLQCCFKDKKCFRIRRLCDMNGIETNKLTKKQMYKKLLSL